MPRPARQLPARASPGEAAVVEYVPGPNNRPLGIVHAHQGLINAIVAGLPPTWGGSKAPPPQMLLHSDLTGVGALTALLLYHVLDNWATHCCIPMRWTGRWIHPHCKAVNHAEQDLCWRRGCRCCMAAA